MLTRIVSQTMQVVIILSVLLVVGNSRAQAAETWSALGTITWLEAGWRLDTLSVGHTAPLVNPDKCQVTTAGYATDPADPGHSLFNTVALSAFMNKKEVQVLISGCVFGKPKIISVKIR